MENFNEFVSVYRLSLSPWRWWINIHWWCSFHRPWLFFHLWWNERSVSTWSEMYFSSTMIQLKIEQIHVQRWEVLSQEDSRQCLIVSDHFIGIHPTNIVCLSKITFQMQYTWLTIPFIREKHRWISTDISSAHPSEKFTRFSIRFLRSKNEN